MHIHEVSVFMQNSADVHQEQSDTPGHKALCSAERADTYKYVQQEF